MHIGSRIVVRALGVVRGRRERDKNSTLKCTKYVELKLWHFVLLFRDARSLSWNVLPNSGLGHSIIREKQITLVGKVVHVKTWSRKGTAVLSVLSLSKKEKKLSLLSWIIATFTFEVFLHIVECIVTVQEMVEYITLHMGSANNYYPEVFLDVFLFFVFHLLTWTTLFFRKWSHLWWECWQGPKLFW